MASRSCTARPDATNFSTDRRATLRRSTSARTRCCWSASLCCSLGSDSRSPLAPFHMWAPDVYEGAPTPITAYMAAAVKAAAFAAFLRLWLEAFPELLVELARTGLVAGRRRRWSSATSSRWRRRTSSDMLAYSSIAHAGYILVAMVVGTSLGSSAFMFYLFAYTLATLGAFGVIVALGAAGEDSMDIEDYAGLWTVRPGLAAAMAVFMLALLGFPIFGGIGFFAKY